MSSIPVIAGGAAVDCKPSVIVGGAEIPIYDAYVVQGGQAIKVYQSAIEWTYAITGTNAASDTVGPTWTLEYYLNGDGRYVQVIFTFKDPVTFKAGDMIEIQPDQASAGMIVSVGSTQIYNRYINDDSRYQTYTFPADMVANTITVYVQQSGTGGFTKSVDLYVTHNGQRFLLNNSGTSDQ